MHFHQLILFGVCMLVALSAASTSASSSGCEIDGHKLATDETYTPKGQCEVYTCNADGSVSGKGCDDEETSAYCQVTPVDTTESYPDCCPRVVCAYAR